MEQIYFASKGSGRNKIPMIHVDNPEFYGRKKKTIDARLYYYKNYHPEEDTRGKVIVHLDNDILNFDEDNLVLINRRTWLLIQNQKLWSDNKEQNQLAINIAKTQDISKTIRRKTGREKWRKYEQRIGQLDMY